MLQKELRLRISSNISIYNAKRNKFQENNTNSCDALQQIRKLQHTIHRHHAYFIKMMI